MRSVRLDTRGDRPRGPCQDGFDWSGDAALACHLPRHLPAHHFWWYPMAGKTLAITQFCLVYDFVKSLRRRRQCHSCSILTLMN